MLALRETPAAYSGGPRLLDRVRHAIRARHYSRRTEKAYVGWIKRYIFFHGKRHPAEMGAAEVSTFLTALAVDSKVAASTQNQAMNALVFLYRVVLDHDLPWLDDVVRARRPRHLPVVFTRDEVRRVLARLDGPPRLIALLLYGCGLRLLECLQLRVKDVDFAGNQITIRSGKGARDRVTMLPATAKPGRLEQLAHVRRQYASDVERNAGWVWLRTRWPKSILEQRVRSDGNGCFRLPVPTSTRPPDSTDDIIFTKPSYSARCAARCARRTSRSTRAATPFVTLSRRIFSKTATTFAPPGTARSPRRHHDDDLHACPQPWPRRCPQPGGPPPGQLTNGYLIRGRELAGYRTGASARHAAEAIAPLGVSDAATREPRA
jgi:integrase